MRETGKIFLLQFVGFQFMQQRVIIPIKDQL